MWKFRLGPFYKYSFLHTGRQLLKILLPQPETENTKLTHINMNVDRNIILNNIFCLCCARKLVFLCISILYALPVGLQEISSHWFSSDPPLLVGHLTDEQRSKHIPSYPVITITIKVAILMVVMHSRHMDQNHRISWWEKAIRSSSPTIN